jgi:hypothetical protein
MLRQPSKRRGVQNNLAAAEFAQQSTEDVQALRSLRLEGVLRSDGGGRPCSIKWLHAAMAARQMLPPGVPPSQQLATFSVALAGESVAAWLRKRGLDGRQTRQLSAWMERLASLQPELGAALRVLVEWANGPILLQKPSSLEEQAWRAFLARRLAALSKQARTTADQSWPVQRIQAMPEEWLMAWRQVVASARGVSSRRNAVAVAADGVHAHLRRLRDLSGSDAARLWQSIGAEIAMRNLGARSLRVPNRLILETLEAEVAPRKHMSRAERKRPRARWDVLLSELKSACGDERVYAFRAIRALLAQYDGWT